MSNYWIIDKDYKDSGERNKNDRFASSFRVSVTQNWGIANSSGVRPISRGYNGDKLPGTGYSCVIIISTLVNVKWDNPWRDILNKDSGKLKYWGDAKDHPNKGYLDWNGNKVLDSIENAIVMRNKQMIPPIMYFQRNISGWVTFKGLFKLNKLRKESYLDQKNSKMVLNYRSYLSRLTENDIDKKWIIERAKLGQDNLDLAPEEWIRYIESI